MSKEINGIATLKDCGQDFVATKYYTDQCITNQLLDYYTVVKQVGTDPYKCIKYSDLKLPELVIHSDSSNVASIHKVPNRVDEYYLGCVIRNGSSLNLKGSTFSYRISLSPLSSTINTWTPGSIASYTWTIAAGNYNTAGSCMLQVEPSNSTISVTFMITTTITKPSYGRDIWTASTGTPYVNIRYSYITKTGANGSIAIPVYPKILFSY